MEFVSNNAIVFVGFYIIGLVLVVIGHCNSNDYRKDLGSATMHWMPVMFLGIVLAICGAVPLCALALYNLITLL